MNLIVGTHMSRIPDYLQPSLFSLIYLLHNDQWNERKTNVIENSSTVTYYFLENEFLPRMFLPSHDNYTILFSPDNTSFLLMQTTSLESKEEKHSSSCSAPPTLSFPPHN